MSDNARNEPIWPNDEFEPKETFELTMDEWKSTYKPIPHSLGKDGPFEGSLLPFNGDAFKKAWDRNGSHPGTVWTYFKNHDDDEGGTMIISQFMDEGEPFQAPLGYFFTELPFEGWREDQLTIHIDGLDAADEQVMSQ